MLRYAALKCHNSNPASRQTFRQMSIRLCCYSHRNEKCILTSQICKGFKFDLHASAIPEQMTRRNATVEEKQVRQSCSAVLPTTRLFIGSRKKKREKNRSSTGSIVHSATMLKDDIHTHKRVTRWLRGWISQSAHVSISAFHFSFVYSVKLHLQ